MRKINTFMLCKYNAAYKKFQPTEPKGNILICIR